jgi:hypothetical protein
VTKGTFEVLDRLLVDLRFELAREARLVNEMAIEIARMKSNPAQPGNVPRTACATCSEYCEDYHGKGHIEVKPKCPSCGVFHPSEECNAGRWWTTCPFCGWWHQDDTAVVDVLDGTGIPAQCRCLKCSRHWNERTVEVTREPTIEPPSWWKVCPYCGCKPSEQVCHWGEIGELLQVRCEQCHHVWEHPDAISEPAPEPSPWWKVCPWCLWEHVDQSAILTANIGEGEMVCVCRKCGKAWKHSDVET